MAGVAVGMEALAISAAGVAADLELIVQEEMMGNLSE